MCNESKQGGTNNWNKCQTEVSDEDLIIQGEWQRTVCGGGGGGGGGYEA